MTEVILPNIDETGSFTNPDVLARLDERYSGGGTGGAATLDELTDVAAAGAVAGQVLTYDSNGVWVPATPSTGGDTTTPPTVMTIGSTSGLDSGSSYNAASTKLTMRIAMNLHKLSFWAITAATYTLSINGVSVATATHSGTTAAQVTVTGLDVNLYVGTHTVKISSSVAAKVRYVSATSIVHTGDGFDFTAAGWVELGSNYTLPFVYEASAGEAIAVSILDDLNDVDTTTVAPAEGQSLVYKNGQWVPGTVVAETAASTDVQGVLVIPLGGVVPSDTPEGTLIFERTA